MGGSPTCRSLMSWRIFGGSVLPVSLAPPCSPDENRLCIPERSNSSALRDSVRWGTSISFARSPAVSPKRTRGLIGNRSCSPVFKVSQEGQCHASCHEAHSSGREPLTRDFSCIDYEKVCLYFLFCQAKLIRYVLKCGCMRPARIGRKPRCMAARAISSPV